MGEGGGTKRKKKKGEGGLWGEEIGEAEVNPEGAPPDATTKREANTKLSYHYISAPVRLAH